MLMTAHRMGLMLLSNALLIGLLLFQQNREAWYSLAKYEPVYSQCLPNPVLSLLVIWLTDELSKIRKGSHQWRVWFLDFRVLEEFTRAKIAVIVTYWNAKDIDETCFPTPRFTVNEDNLWLFGLQHALKGL
jgi:hypothetical protein